MAEAFAYGGQTILSHPIFVETILPFVLIFVIIFAVLQKSKIFGEGKKQIDAIVALVAALIVISFAQAVGIIIQLIPFLAVTLIVIIVLMILLGSFLGEGHVPSPIKYILITVVTIAVVVAIMLFTGAWSYLMDIIYSGGIGGSGIFMNILFIVIIAAAVVAVVLGAGKAKSS